MASRNQLTNSTLLHSYLKQLEINGLSPSTIRRKRVALTLFSRYLQNTYQPKSTSLPPQNISNNSIQSRLLRFLPFLVILLLFSGLGFFLYRQSIRDATPNLAYPSSLTRPTRRLSFQGRLTDSSGNVITTPSNIGFKLYNAAIGGTQLYTTGTGGTVVPDTNGIFSVVIGDQIGSEISSDVFTENQNVYLEITMNPNSTPEIMTPRQQIATVGYALNSETLQGFPAGNPATANTILVMDNTGNINLGYTSPTLKSTAGTFGIEGQALTLRASTGSGGSLTLSPDANGVLNLTFGGTTPVSSGFINVTNANMTTGNVMSIRINNDNRGYDFLNFQNYNPSTTTLGTRFRVDAGGNTDIGGTLTLSNSINVGSGTTALFIDPSTNIVSRRALGDLAFQSSASLGWYLSGNSGSPQTIAVGDTVSLNGTNGINTVAQSTDTLNVSLGGTLSQNTTIGTSSFSFNVLGLGNTGGLTVLSNGYVGIGTTNPGNKLTVIGDALITNGIGVSGTSVFTNGFTSNASSLFTAGLGTTGVNISGTALVLNGIGVTGNSMFSGSLRVGGTLLDTTNVAGSAGQVLVSTGTGVSWTTATGATYTSSNGITLVATDFRLGGDLTQNTTIGTSSFSFNVQGLGNTGGLTVLSNGYIGIGTTNPTRKLEVTGDAYISTNLTIGGTFVSVGSTNLVTNLNANYLNGIPSTGFVDIGSTGNFITTLTGGSAVSITGTGVGRTINATGTNGLSYVSGSLGLGGTLAQNTNINLSSFNLSFLGVNNNTQPFYIGLSGANPRIGIGTTNPGYALEVTGDALVSTRLGIGATDANRGLFVNANGVGITGNSVFTNNLTVNGTGLFTTGLGTTGLNVSGTALVLNGIGVTGNSMFSGSLQIGSTLKDSFGSTGASGQILVTTGTGVSWAPNLGTTYTSSNGITLVATDFRLGGDLTQNTTIGTSSFSFNVQGLGNTGGLTVLSNGYVGIGTTNPGNKLTVIGDALITSGLGVSGTTIFTNGFTSNASSLFTAGLGTTGINISGTALVLNGIGITGNSVFTNNLTVNGTGLFTTGLGTTGLNVSGTTLFLSGMGVTGNVTLTNNLTIGGTFVSVGSTNLVTNLNANYLNGIPSTGFVDIGSTGNFITTLTGGSAVSITGTGVGRTINATGTNGLSYVSGSLGLGGTLAQNTNINLSSFNLSFLGVNNNTQPFYIGLSGANPRIGIGTTNPGYALEVTGDAYISTNLTVGGTFVSVGSTNLVSNLNANYLNGIPSTGFVGTGQTGNFITTLTAGSAVSITGTGVGRTINATGTNGLSYVSGSLGLGGTLTQTTNIGTSSFSFNVLGLGNTGGLTVLSNGYIGIGTTNPNSMLTILGDFNNSSIYVGTSGVYLANRLAIGTGTTTITQYSASSSSSFVASTTYYQSFTSTHTGPVNIDVCMASAPLNASLLVGDGTSGASMGNATQITQVGTGCGFVGSHNWYRLYFNAATVVSNGNSYTVAYTAGSNVAVSFSNANPYAGGRAYSAGWVSTDDAVFVVLDTNSSTITWNQIGIGTTKRSSFISGLNDLFVSGNFEVGSTSIFSSPVGIGTTNPIYALNVNGDAMIGTRLGIGVTNASYGLFVNANGIGVSGTSLFTGSLQIGSTLKDSFGSTGVSGQALVTTGTGVSWAPVSGSASATNGLQLISSSVGLGGTLTQTTNIGTSSFSFNVLGLGNTGGLTVLSNGYIGIGTTNPTRKLEVIGDAYISTNLTIGGTFVSVGSTNLVTNLNANYLNGIPSTGFVDIGSTGNFITTLTGGSAVSITGTGVGRTINATGTNGLSYVSGSLGLGGTLSQNTLINLSSASFSILGVNNNTQVFFVGLSGTRPTIGIGTTAQNYGLEVRGDALVSTRLGIGATDANRGLFVNANGIGVTGSSVFSGSLRVGGTLLDTTNVAGAAGQILVSTGTGVSWTTAVAGSVNATNGLKMISTAVGLGGTLTQDTQIGTSSFTLTFESTGSTITNFAYTANNLSTGRALALTSTSAALSTGNLAYYEWNPGVGTSSTSDLFVMNIGSSGNTTGSIFAIKDTGSDLFSVSESAVTSTNPLNVTASGDVSIAYDLNFTNPTASYVRSAAPLYLVAGEVFNSSDLTLRTYNSGNIILDAGINGAVVPLNNITTNLGSTTNRFNLAWIKTLNLGTSTWSFQSPDNSRLSIFNRDSNNASGTEVATFADNGNFSLGTTQSLGTFQINSQLGGTGAVVVVSSTGGVAIGATGTSTYRLSVTAANTSGAAYFTNNNTGNTLPTVVIQTNSAAVGTTGAEFIRFLNASGTKVGRIRMGNGTTAVAYTTTGTNDFAEYVLGSENIEVMDLVAYDTNSKFKKAVIGDQLAGTYSNFATYLGNESIADQPNAFPLAMIGIVDVKINSQNGSIKTGDAIAASTIPGVASRAVSAGTIVGRALEDYNNADPNHTGVLRIYVYPGYYDPGIRLADNGTIQTDFEISPQVLASLNFNDSKNSLLSSNYTLKDAAGNTLTQVGNFSKLLVARLETGLISAKTIVTSRLVADTAITKDLKTDTLTVTQNIGTSGTLTADTATFKNVTAQTATFSTLYADQIISSEGNFGQVLTNRVAALREELTGLVQNLGTGATPPPVSPAPLANDVPNWTFDIGTSSATLSGNFFLTDNMQIGSKLQVSGQTILSDALVSGILQVESIKIGQNYLSSISNNLAIQPNRTGTVSILGDILTIADTGSVVVTGDLSVTGSLAAKNGIFSDTLLAKSIVATDASISGSLAARNILTEGLSIATDSSQLIVAQTATSSATTTTTIQSNATAGLVTLPSGTTDLEINTNKLTPSSLVYLTPNGSSQNQVVYVKSKSANSFVIGVDNPLTTDLPITWWIIN